MKCPRCSQELKVMTTSNVRLDVCQGGCGGIWFDKFELDKLDEKTKVDQGFLDSLDASKAITADLAKRIQCPKCSNVVMLRNFFSVKKEVEVDHCSACGGYWLDVGELMRIHSEFPTAKDRLDAARKMFDQISAPLQSQMQNENEAKREPARIFTKIIRFIFGPMPPR